MSLNVDRRIVQKMADYMNTHLSVADKENIYIDLINKNSVHIANTNEIIKYFEKMVKEGGKNGKNKNSSS